MKQFIIFGIASSLFFTLSPVNAFDDFDSEFESSYERQRSNARDAFEDFDKEFEEPRERRPAPAPRNHTPEPREASSSRPVEEQAEPRRERAVRQQVAMPAPSSIIETKPAEGYDITLKSCKKIHNSIECELSAVDDEFDGGLLVYRAYGGHGESRMIDNMANVYSPNKLNVKDKETSGGYLEVLTLRNVPTEFTLNYENFSGKASTIHTLIPHYLGGLSLHLNRAYLH